MGGARFWDFVMEVVQPFVLSWYLVTKGFRSPFVSKDVVAL
jgi:hypothetical protein